MHSVNENSESQDGESQGRSSCNTYPAPFIGATTSSGYYDAEKCRAHIANQIKVSKIDRFAAQISRAIEVEASIQSRLCNIFNMFVKRSAQVTHDFTFKCKSGLQRHRQDRILNQRRKSSLKNNKKTTDTTRLHQQQHHHHHHPDTRQYSISNDLLYGPGAQLLHSLLTQSLSHSKQPIIAITKPTPPSTQYIENNNNDNFASCSERASSTLSEDDYLLSDLFEPTLFVKKLKDCIQNNMQKSETITLELSAMRQLFERLASEHRDQVDLVYSAEEERQTKTVIRRSAYNLSMAAIKATSTPVHVNSNNEIS